MSRVKIMIQLFFLPSMFALLRHVLEDCVAVEACRVREGIRTFLSECRRAGWSRATSYRFYITGMDEGGVKIPRIDHLLRGASLVRLTDMWLSTWTQFSFPSLLVLNTFHQLRLLFSLQKVIFRCFILTKFLADLILW